MNAPALGRRHALPPGAMSKRLVCAVGVCPVENNDKFPRRPDSSVFSESIPLFFIGRNKVGLWVAREADGRAGGIFLFKRSALRFARKRSDQAGCATMILTEPLELELDLENQGSPLLGNLAVAALAAARKLFTRVSRALAGEREHRRAIEKELFHDQYMLCSKCDDDLPIVP